MEQGRKGFRMELASIYYYDFWVAAPNSNPSEWKYQAWKLRSESPKQAALCKIVLSLLKSNKKKLELDFVLMMSSARMSIRRIVEYELSCKEGKTKYRFKKRFEYYIDENLKIKEI